ncbi:MAG: aerobic carbon-monoxide dehydrogenase medium subunit [Chloroflexota bacterium]|jgi:carbon-monoxide dehydrogenase medium subunit|nr:aerobic carbon-monoxide dehydrogenase medium subunit [Chloroflexota bacterium]
MIPAAFEYVRPESLVEALDLLAAGDEGTKVIAGGHSLLPLLKLRLATPERLVDIGRLRDLRGIGAWEDGLAIGGAATYAEVLASDLARERCPLLGRAIHDVGDVQVRNRGTLGGSLAHADPASDMPAVALALDAQLVLRSAAGERVVDADGFFLEPFVTALRPDELLVQIRIPGLPGAAGTTYRQLMQPASGFSVVGVAVVVARAGGTVSHVRVGVTGVGDHPYRATAVEAALAGTDGGPSSIAAAAVHAADGQQVNSDIHADREYRTAMAAVYVRRALEAALADA